MGKHYRRMADAFAHVLGAKVALDLGQGPCKEWAPASLAKLLLHAYPEAFALVDGHRRVDASGLVRHLEAKELTPRPWLADTVARGSLVPFVLVLKTVERVRAEKDAEARRWWKT